MPTMSRRHAPTRHWHVGDHCQTPHYQQGHVAGWQDGEVVALRGDLVVVRQYRWESEHPAWELRQPPAHVGLWRRWWNHG